MVIEPKDDEQRPKTGSPGHLVFGRGHTRGDAISTTPYIARETPLDTFYCQGIKIVAQRLMACFYLLKILLRVSKSIL